MDATCSLNFLCFVEKVVNNNTLRSTFVFVHFRSEAGQNLTDAPKFIIQMYGHYNQIRSHQNQLRQTLEKSIKKYSLDTPVPPELVAYSFSLDTFAKQVLEFPIVNTSVLDVLVNKECEYTNIGERTRNRNSQIPSSWDLFMPLNKVGQNVPG